MCECYRRPRKRTRLLQLARQKAKMCLHRILADLQSVSGMPVDSEEAACIPLNPLPYLWPRSLPSLPSCVQSAMRPNLSPLEKGAYGTPSSVVEVVTSGPHSSPRLSELIVSAMLIPGIFATTIGLCCLTNGQLVFAHQIVQTACTVNGWLVARNLGD